MTGDVELIRSLIVDYRDSLDTLTDAGPVRGYAAEDEIEEAINHLNAAIVDLEDAMEE